MSTRIASAENVRLKEILTEASEALAHLDAERLERLALYCEMLIEEPSSAVVERAGRETEMAVFSHVLDATRANLRVMRRLRELRATEVDGHAPAVRAVPAEAQNGHN